MAISDYVRQLRERVGHQLLLLPSAAVALLDDRKRLLLGLHADRGIWVLPGGLIEPGEVPADAAMRETWEETGLEVELTGVLGVYGGPDFLVDYANGDCASYVATIFRGRIIGGDARPDGNEILELRYFSAAELSSVARPKWIERSQPILFDEPGTTQFQAPLWHPPAQ